MQTKDASTACGVRISSGNLGLSLSVTPHFHQGFAMAVCWEPYKAKFKLLLPTWKQWQLCQLCSNSTTMGDVWRCLFQCAWNMRNTLWTLPAFCPFCLVWRPWVVNFAASKHHRRELASKRHYHRKLMAIQRTAPVTSEVILEIHVHQLCLICQASLDHTSFEWIHMGPIHKSDFYDKCKCFWLSQNSHIVLLITRLYQTRYYLGKQLDWQ